VHAVAMDGTRTVLGMTVRLDTAREVAYYRHGGIMPYVLRSLWTAGGRTGRALSGPPPTGG
jgi:aconitate hydratase